MRRSFFLFLLAALLVFGGYRYYQLSRPGQGLRTMPQHYTPAVRPKLDPKEMQVLAALDNEYSRLINSVVPSVVSITSSRIVELQQALNPIELFFNIRRAPRQQEQSSLGSGVIVSREGHILTNNHVIAGMQRIQVQLTDGRVEPAQLIGTDAATDIAVLKIEARNIEPLPFGDSDGVRAGQIVFAIGNPFGLQETVTQGIVSAKGRRAIADSGVECIQTDAAVNPGNSGGPLLNIRGEIVGINSSIYTGQEKGEAWLGISFAIPSNTARRTLESLLKSGRVIRGYLGVRTAALKPEIARLLQVPDTAGAAVVDVDPSSPLEKAGLKPEDVIRTFNGRAVADPLALTTRIAEQEIGAKVELGILRRGREMKISTEIAEIPGEGAAGSAARPLRSSGEPFALAGVQVAEMPTKLRDALGPDVRGVVAAQVAATSPVAGKIAAGDLIEGINRRAVRSVAEYEAVVQSLAGGDQVLLQIVRGRTRLMVVVP